MRLGGFVIHGNTSDTLGECLESLQAVCDEVVALDSDSTDGSAAIAVASGVRTANHRWRGYGNARATAAGMLTGCDYLTYLDADERYAAGAVKAFREWKAHGPREPYFRMLLHDWAEPPSGRFRFRSLRPYRLFRQDTAQWRASMMVHESVPKHFGNGRVLPGVEIDHRFAPTFERRAEKQERYALLWAVQAHEQGQRVRPHSVQRIAHLARNALIKGAALRGGLAAWQLSATVAGYHARKYERLAELGRGQHPELVLAYRAGRYEDVFALVGETTAAHARRG